MLKEIIAPPTRFTDRFNAFCRPVSAPALTFKILCPHLKVAEVRIDGAYMGRIVEHGPDKFNLIAPNDTEYGYENLLFVQGMVINMVTDRMTLKQAWEHEHHMLDTIGF